MSCGSSSRKKWEWCTCLFRICLQAIYMFKLYTLFNAVQWYTTKRFFLFFFNFFSFEMCMMAYFPFISSRLFVRSFNFNIFFIFVFLFLFSVLLYLFIHAHYSYSISCWLSHFVIFKFLSIFFFVFNYIFVCALFLAAKFDIDGEKINTICRTVTDTVFYHENSDKKVSFVADFGRYRRKTNINSENLLKKIWKKN